MFCGICVCALLLVAGCSKAPRTLQSAQIRASVSTVSAEQRVIAVEGVIYNENSSVAFSDYSAQIVLKGKDGTVLLSVPVKTSDILPFMTVQLDGEVTVDKTMFDRLASAFSLVDPALTQGKERTSDDEGTPVPEDQVALEKVSYTRVSIEKLLKEGRK